MLAKARKLKATSGKDNVEFIHSRITKIDLPSSSADCIISNCVINLVEDKAAVFAAVHDLLKPGGELLVNELAPRPHNSGHATIDACVTSQFEQQVRAVCGLPLGDTALLRPAAMANLLGDLWPGTGEPPWERILAHRDVKLHLYGKLEARPGRKMGHLTALADTPEAALAKVLSAREALKG